MKKIFSIFLFQFLCGTLFSQCDTPVLEFQYPYGYEEITIEVYQDNELKKKVISKDTIFTIGQFSYGHDFRIILKKKKYTTKIVDVHAKGYTNVTDKKTIVNLGGALEPRKNFKSNKPFKVPVALIRIDSKGNLNYDDEYIRVRKEEIEKYRKKHKR
jgi:hypothetical protein